MGPRRYYIIGVILLISNIIYADWSEPTNLNDINSEENEFAPYFDSDSKELIFNSDRSGNSLFYIYQDSTISLMKGKLNSKQKNSSYFTKTEPKTAIISSFRKGERQSYLNLFYSNFIKNEWSEGNLIEELAGDYFVSQATVSKNGKLLVFVSNKDNDPNDTDLFLSYMRGDGKWDTPVNIDRLNTSGKEMTPYFVGNDTLFFASDGKGGEGGLELFMSVRELGTWQRPLPLNRLNSAYNESDPAFINGTLYFSSDRPSGKGNLDLYKSNIIEETKKINKDEIQVDIQSYVSVIKLNVKENQNNQLIFPYIIFEKDQNKIDNSYLPEFQNLINIIKKKNNSKITLIAWLDGAIEENKLENNSKVLADKRLKSIIKKLKENSIDTNNIITKYDTDINFGNNNPDNILVLIDDKLPSKKEKKEISIEPKVFEFFVYPKPKNEVKNIKTAIFANDSFTGLEKTITQIPGNFKYDISKISEEISRSDSLVVEIVLELNDNSIIQKKSHFFITKSTNKNISDTFDFYLLKGSHLESIYFKSSLEKLMNDFYNGEKLEIYYNSKIEKSSLESIANIFGSNLIILENATLKEDYLIQIKKVN